MSVEPIDAETTTLMTRTGAPLPPYAQPAGSYPATALPRSEASAPVAPRQSMADAMIEISAPASSTTELAAPVEPPAARIATQPAPEPARLQPVAMPAPAAETITCPECGTLAQVTLNRRDSVDFCRTCDFPLFWTPSKVYRDPSDSADESLRRLPGQAGRATVAALPCPFCAEPNALSAQTCIRCHRPMHPVEAPAPPAPVYVAPPEPVVAPPEPKVSWWVWALLALGAAAVITLVVLIATHTIG